MVRIAVCLTFSLQALATLLAVQLFGSRVIRMRRHAVSWAAVFANKGYVAAQYTVLSTGHHVYTKARYVCFILIKLMLWDKKSHVTPSFVTPWVHLEVTNERALAAITGIFHCSQLIDDVNQNTILLPAVWAGLTGTTDKPHQQRCSTQAVVTCGQPL